MSQSKQFSPSVIDYDGRMSADYESGRALSTEAANIWAKIVAPFVQHDEGFTILDLGAGTGRFAALFAREFKAQVIGIEPSKGMLTVATRGDKATNLAYAAGAAECIPLRSKSCDLVWLSQVWHHIRDHHACARELHRIGSLGSHVLVRGAFGDQLDGFPTFFRFWPSTREICQQLPTIRQTVDALETNGFVLAEHRRVRQVTATSLSEFAKRTQLRADTALALISDSEFREGQMAIEKSGALETRPEPVIETIELLVFRTNASRSTYAN
jgi:ubiquinone/menaquinone biosynthesis C-methylase UbiE